MNFRPFEPAQHDSKTCQIIASLPQPVEVKRLPANDGWCIRVTKDGLDLVAIGVDIEKCGTRMLQILKTAG